ncbi:class I SAM-dependent methyltransferase [Chitinophagales bacterium]|nr:class I SAM-dependent methyltransferase [Chitinophagales bacterium]
MGMQKQQDWFKGWFNSDYYHLLYRNRDHKEAADFVANLVDYLPIAKGSEVLDLACGKGRHSIELWEHGLRVTGVDLSPASIEFAQQSAKEGLAFRVLDMREAAGDNQFDAVFNLFTSFGYFDQFEENRTTLEAVHTALKPEGQLIIDYLNIAPAIARRIPEEAQLIESVYYHIKRWDDGQKIYKEIEVQDGELTGRVREQVSMLQLSDFEKLADGLFDLKAVFGNYHLEDYDPAGSPRLILHFEKKLVG